MKLVGSWAGQARDEFGDVQAIELTVGQKPEHLTFAASLGGDRCFFRLNEGRFTGELAGYGELELEQIAPHLFRSKMPLDGAGEFQWRLSWQFSDDLWLWEFRCGLTGTRSKGGELRWDLWPKT